MQPTVLFIPDADHYLVGDPQAPVPWVGDNPDALASLHRIVEARGGWVSVDAFGGSLGHVKTIPCSLAIFAHITPAIDEANFRLRKLDLYR